MRRRPHLGGFLRRCAELFEVVVFTASQKVYAEQLLNILDPSRRALRCFILSACSTSGRPRCPKQVQQRN